jgi:Cu(I)/Ag(I) efflux system periplasmic protein CusF
MKAIHTLVFAASLFASGGVFAQAAPQSGSSAAATAQAEGEVRKVDVAQGKVTLRHGPLTSLDMPAMTMVFTATDKKLLDGLKEGDKVRFTADKQNGTFVVTAIEHAK